MRVITRDTLDLPDARTDAAHDALPARRRGGAAIRIVHVINDLTVGGAEMMLYKLLSSTDHARHDTTVVTLCDGGELREGVERFGVRVHGVGMRAPAPSPSSLLRLVRLVRRLDPDLIQGWMYYGNIGAQIAAAFSPRPPATVWNIRQSVYSLAHEKPVTALAIRLGARLSSRPAAIIYNSMKSAAQHESLGYKASKTRIIHNGFDTAAFVPSVEARASVRVELGLTPDALLVGLIGRYHPAKDHANFLRAAAALSKGRPEVRFVLSGRGVHRGNDALCEAIGHLGLGSRVHLLGERQDVTRLMASFDIIVSSSRREGFPNVIGEAMSCGVPCVVTDVGDSAKLVGPTGLVVPPRNPEALAQAGRELIHLGSKGRAKLGEAARERIRENFHLESVVAQYEALYSDVLRE
jgi:glycosyltransferase involved in cell wall biosynthesis